MKYLGMALGNDKDQCTVDKFGVIEPAAPSAVIESAPQAQDVQEPNTSDRSFTGVSGKDKQFLSIRALYPTCCSCVFMQRDLHLDAVTKTPVTVLSKEKDNTGEGDGSMVSGTKKDILSKP